MTTLLKKEQALQNLYSVVHEGKVVVLATDVDSKIWYTIKQDGFEDSYLNTPADQRTGWENWQLLEFPNENDDQSVINQEKSNLTYQSDTGKFILRSRYKTVTETAVAPVQALSALGHVYVFRQSKTNTLLVDRFVLDGMTNKLNRKLEVRFKRSKQRLTPIKTMKKTAGALTNVDSLDFRDANGNFFYEPTTEVCAVGNLYQGWFSVVLVPTIENDISRWHIFAYNSQTQKVEVTTIRASSEGLFDVKDYTIFEAVDDGFSPRKIPGLIKRSLEINGVTVTNGLSATKYDLQQAQQTQSGEEQLLKTATRLMLAIPTDKGTAAFSFGIAGDGTLAEIDDTPDSNVLRSRQREILLPLNVLDEVKGFADRTPPPQGIIQGLALGTAEDDAEDLVKIITDQQAAALENGDMVKITGTTDYQGLYRSRKIDDDTFEIDVTPGGELGYWEKEESEASGLIFDGMISAYAKTADGKLQVTCPGHGLENGDEVQIAGTDSYNNSYPVQTVDDTHFVIDRKWATGEAVNVKLVSRRRRGVVFDGMEDYIALDDLAYDFNQGITVEAWVYYDAFRSWSRVVDLGNGSGLDNIVLANEGSTNNLSLHIYRGGVNQFLTASGVLELGKWTHIAASIDKLGNAALYKNGVLVQQGKVHLPNKVNRTRNYVGRSNWSGDAYFAGRISDLRLWKQSRSGDEIKDTMYLQLTGKELGLVGYWRLGAIAEGKVIDFSPESNDGTVYGDCFVSAATLNRKLAAGGDAVKYSNPELFAVSERATYEESFEFKINNTTPLTLADLDNADGRNLGTKVFNFVYWGKPSRSAEERKVIAAEQIKQNKFEDLGNGWFKASANVTIPDGVSLLRTFEIGNIKGTWRSIEIRKHRVRLVSDSITEAKYTDSINLRTLADEQVGLPAKLQQLDTKEQENAVLLVEKWRLEQQLAALANLPQTEARIAQLKVEITGLEGEQRRYQAEIDKLFNYWCTLRNVGLNTTLQVMGTIVMALQNNPNDAAHHWRIEQVEGSWHRLENRQNGLTMMRVDPGVAQTPFSWQTIQSFGGVVTDTFSKAAQWSLDKIGDNYRIRERLFNTFELLPVGGFTLCVHPYILGTQQQWQIVSTGQPVNPSGMDATKSALEKTLANLKNKREELQRLEEVVRDGRTKEAAWKKRLAEIIALLPQIQTAINTLNNDFLEAIRKIQQKPQSLLQLSKDSKGLLTQGALLGFVQPASRLTAIETCEGNVQLSYFDVQGRMRQTVYDATADSRNSAFEQWIPDAQRACLNFDKTNSWLTLNKPLILPGNWTIEAWFFYPFPETSEWNTLVRGQSVDHHILVRNRKQLGIYLQNDPLKQYFYESGFSMELLTQGWHHIAAVGLNDTTLFYIDGKQVGDTKAKAVAVAQDNFNQFPNDAAIKQKLADIKKATIKSVSDVYTIANTPDGKQPFGKVAELRIWGTALTPEEIAVNSNIVLTGNEPSLLAYCPMSEATGTVVRDASGNDNGGRISNVSWWGCAAPIGNPGNTVMKFDGINDSITVADNGSLRVKAYTVELWIKPDGLPNEEWKGIIGKPGRSFHIWLNQAGYLHHRYHTSVSINEGAPNTPNGSIIWGQWQHIAITNDGTTSKTYINGKLSASGAVNGGLVVDNTTLYLGCNLDNGAGNYFKGQMADVRIWKTARTELEIQTGMYQRLSGKEPNLTAYYPLNEIKPEGGTQKTPDLANGNHGRVNEAITTFESTLPIGADALVSAEYSNITIDPTTNRKLALMRRFFAYPTTNGAVLLPEKRIETLELKWIGNAQFAPTLLGYIEGAPPLPSENLTIEEDYNGATSIELVESDDVEFSWNRSQDSGLGASVETFIGAGGTMSFLTAPMGVGTAIDTSTKIGFKGNFDFSYQFQNESNITSSSSLSMSDKLELRGTPEETPKFPHLGTRFIPKNVGYALVISATADVFVTRLARSGKMVGYQVQPVDGIPPDVNTITFLMNPAYTMNGSLDGLTGSCATSERFFKHVPEMRSQYGSLYPASYYRLKEAYDLKQAIEAEDKRRESYFSNFDVRLVDETSLNRNIDSGDAPTTIGVKREEDQPATQMTAEEKAKAQDEKANQFQADSAAAADKTSAASKAKQAEIQSKISDQDKRVQATDSFAGWQKRMEALQIRAGKRNIVNTYVWDADGGLRTEAQSFASTVEHTIGGSFAMNAGLGIESEFAVAGVDVELTAQATVNLTQTMNKTESRSKGFELNVDLSGVESKGITDHNDFPLLPGEKVDRYRFMSFYLEGSTQHFQDFFNYVVDPEWLASNDEEARALRQTQAGKPNKTWRVLHRVTYVERPALMGFGRDVRKVRAAAETSENQAILDKIANLEESNKNLAKQLDLILKKLNP
jgi:hypothetical protein